MLHGIQKAIAVAQNANKIEQNLKKSEPRPCGKSYGLDVSSIESCHVNIEALNRDWGLSSFSLSCIDDGSSLA